MSLTDFFLSAPADVIELELFEIAHPDFSQPYRYVRNHRAGVTVNLPNGGSAFFEFRPAVIRRSRSVDDIQQGISIDVGDPGEIIVNEADRVAAAGSFDVKPTLKYWVFRSDDLAVPLVGPLSYEVISISTKSATATIEAQAPERNQSSTGDTYTFTRFPMLRGEI